MTSKAVTISKTLSLGRPTRFSLLAQCGILTAVLCLMFCVAGPVGFFFYGWAGVISVATAVAICWLAGALGAIVVELAAPSAGALAFLLGMGMRMMLPLGFLLWAWVRESSLMRTGFVPALLCSYFVVLAMETFFACGRAGLPSHSEGHRSDG